MRQWIMLAVVVAALCGTSWGQEQAATEDKPRIDVVFCIDCSGSMGSVIEAAKQKVWAIVNETARAKPSPELRIGLIGYGNADRSFRIFDLSGDLDEVYKNLTTFKDEGWGDEYVGLVVQKAVRELSWSKGKQVLKLIYVVGNETARQGQVDYTASAPEAIKNDIMVNAIYCGQTDYQTATPTWKEMAKLADGQYMEIDQSGGVVIVNTPFDTELAALNTRLNSTYIAYGAAGASGAANQGAQDRAAATLSSAVLAERVAAKSQAQYSNARWDLVDAAKEKDFDLKKVAEDQLPEDMRKLTPDQRPAFVEQKAKERAEVQKQIQELSQKREAFVKAELEKQGQGGKGLDAAVKDSLRKQAEKKGFQFAE